VWLDELAGGRSRPRQRVINTAAELRSIPHIVA
jgi:hypothetical protein